MVFEKRVVQSHTNQKLTVKGYLEILSNSKRHQFLYNDLI